MNHYTEKLQNIPAPGGGCHVALLAVANSGARANVPPEQIHFDIRNNIPPGNRKITDKEIQDAIQKAFADRQRPFYTPKPAPQLDGTAALQRIINQAKATTEADLWELSDRIDWEPHEDAWRFLAAMFRPGAFVFIGDRVEAGVVGKNIRTTSEWIDFFQSGGEAGPFIIVNPLTGKPAPAKSGDRETYRGDGCVAAYQYALAEFDNLSLKDQISFWTGAKLPVKALTFSGKKSIHAWLEVDISDAAAWEREIRVKLYRGALIPLGIDSACQNPARLARLPGVKRGGQWQKLLYFKGQLND